MAGERPSQGAENYRKAAKKIKINIGRVGKYYRKANLLLLLYHILYILLFFNDTPHVITYQTTIAGGNKVRRRLVG